MTELTMMALAVLMILRRAPETAIGNWLHARITVPLAARLARVRRRTVVVVLLVAAAVAVLGREGAQVVAMGVPDAVAFFATIDLGVFVDFLAAALVGVMLLPIRRLAKPNRPARSRAKRRRPARVANDDDGERRPLAA